MVSGGSLDVEVILLAYFPEGDPAFDVVGDLSDDYYRVTFVRITDDEVAKSVNLNKHGVAIVRPAIPEVRVSAKIIRKYIQRPPYKSGHLLARKSHKRSHDFVS